VVSKGLEIKLFSDPFILPLTFAMFFLEMLVVVEVGSGSGSGGGDGGGGGGGGGWRWRVA